MYTFRFSTQFERNYNKLTKKNTKLKQKIDTVLLVLQDDPSHQSLHTHRVDAKHYGKSWSSRVTGDIRIIWDYDENKNLVLLILNIGGHSGKKAVY